MTPGLGCPSPVGYHSGGGRQPDLPRTIGQAAALDILFKRPLDEAKEP